VPPKAGEPVHVGEGEAVLVDELGAAPILLQMSDGSAPARAVLLDLGGRLNKSAERAWGRFLFAPGQAIELVAELIVCEFKVNPQAGEQMLDFVKRRVEELESEPPD